MTSNNENDYLVIVNPNAGRRKGEKDWEKISSLLRSAGVTYKAVFTQAPRHAIDISVSHIESGYRKLIVVEVTEQ